MSALTGFTSLHLPILGAALVIAMLATAVAGRFIARPGLLLIGFLLVLVFCLLPWTGIAHWGRIITGDLSVVTLVWFTFRVIDWLVLPVIAPRVGAGQAVKKARCGQPYIAAVIVVTALVLYPTALGLTWFDLYAYGYYPVLLAPALFTLFAWCLWFGHTLPAVLLATAYACWTLGILESDNLWDYLIDPVVTVYALVFLVRQRINSHRPAACNKES